MCHTTPTPSPIHAFVIGDRIQVVTASGLTDTGVFIRITDNVLYWVRDDGATALFTQSSLSGINISKL